jgi:uncharacterized protein YjbI with pentapeptide repeats
MMIEIKNRFTGLILFSIDSDNMKLAIKAAIKSKVDLCGSDLRWSDLSGSYLSGSDLHGSDLRGSDLSWSDLHGSKIINVKWPAPPMFLLASWFTVSDKLTLDLMRYDASNHPYPEAFLEWAKDGKCPYNNVKIQRSANFQEKRSLITDNFLKLKVRSAYELMQDLLKECCKEE